MIHSTKIIGHFGARDDPIFRTSNLFDEMSCKVVEAVEVTEAAEVLRS